MRSVGPAGDAVRTLDWDGGRLRVNGRFSLHLTPSPASVSVGLEGPAGWTTAAAPQSRRCMDRNGWCYARIELTKPGEYRLAIEDAYPDVVFKFRGGRYWRGGCPIQRPFSPDALGAVWYRSGSGPGAVPGSSLYVQL